MGVIRLIQCIQSRDSTADGLIEIFGIIVSCNLIAYAGRRCGEQQKEEYESRSEDKPSSPTV